MATFFHGNPEIPVGQDGGLQTMVLMNPTTTYLHFNSDQDPPAPQSHPNNNNGNLLLFNPSSAVSAGNLLPPPPHHPGHGQQFDNVSVLHGFIPRVHYNLYGTPADSPHSARETPRSQRGLSLTLSSERRSNPSFGSGGGSVSPAGSGHVANVVVSGMQGLALSSKYLKAAQELLDEVVSVNNSMVDHNSKSELSKKSGDNNKETGESTGGDEATGGVNTSGGGCGGKYAAELTGAERQEIQMKKAKLVSMLDEVDQRYKQYHHQMHIIVSSFEQAAGVGSAKTYTSLALKTISKQFRSLRDAVIGQIKAVNNSLGEEDGRIEGGSSRLRFVDHHLRQQRALQQLGMIHHTNNAWRPQRGLPERAVSVLRAWLFEHFLHPYPKDSDKLMLAKQTGLTRSQVSNWFINARVRLWKPMVEEMYMEEMKEQEKISGSSEDQKTKQFDNQDENSASKSIGSENPQNKFIMKQDSFMNTNNNRGIAMSVPMSTSASPSPSGGGFQNPSGFAIVGTSELEGITQASPKKPRISELLHSPLSVPSVNMDVNKVREASSDNISPKFRDEKQFSFIGSNTNFIGGFGQYPIGETARFEAEPFTPRYSGNNGVSLTLGLPHCENFSVSAATHQNFFPNQNVQLGRTVEMAEPNGFGAMTTSEPHSSAAAYNTISIQNQRRFAAQLLPDFVA